jgi:hypothetical protein
VSFGGPQGANRQAQPAADDNDAATWAAAAVAAGHDHHLHPALNTSRALRLHHAELDEQQHLYTARKKAARAALDHTARRESALADALDEKAMLLQRLEVVKKERKTERNAERRRKREGEEKKN